MEKLPVLILHSVPPKPRGGVKRFADELIRGMNFHGMGVTILLGRQDRSIWNNFIKISYEYLKSLQKVKLVHFIVLSPYDIPFMILAKLFGKKIVSTYHGIYREESSLMGEPHVFIPFRIADTIYRKCSDIIVSPNSYLLQKLNISGKNMVIPNPFNSQIFDGCFDHNVLQSNGEILLIAASNFDIKKKSNALQILLDAMDFVWKKHPEVKLLVFGDGANLHILKSKYGDKKNITFMGFRQDFRNFLRDSNAYVHISGLDVQPYSVIEAAILGKVILCNNIGSLLETIDPKNNYVVSLEIESIVQGLFSLIGEIKNEKESFREKGLKNRKFAIERYSAEVVSMKYLKLYGSIIGETYEDKTNV